jgi:soluble lytic murein transglycosylase-like protein
MRKLVYIGLMLSTTLSVGASHEQVIDAIIKAADQVGVPRELPLAICWVESSYRTSGVTHMDGDSPSYGICQIKLETALFVAKVYKHKYLPTPKRLSDLYVNALYACKYLKLQLKRYGGDWESAIDAYNKGNLINRNSHYVRKVKKAMKRPSARGVCE